MDYSSDSSGYEETSHYNQQQQSDQDYLADLRAENEQRGSREYLSNRLSPGMEQLRRSVAQAAARFERIRQALETAGNSWARHPESQTRQRTYQTAANHNDEALFRYVRVATQFEESVADALDHRDRRQEERERIAAADTQPYAATPQGGPENPLADYINFNDRRAEEVRAQVRQNGNQGTSRQENHSRSASPVSSRSASPVNGTNGRGRAR
ncbi:hypothetical protein [Streptomyces olivaceus]|uniref:hypothetical protein n=1 Tax=Streptomyces olivaceus TaxID=47716 RepID=UPI0040563575